MARWSKFHVAILMYSSRIEGKRSFLGAPRGPIVLRGELTFEHLRAKLALANWSGAPTSAFRGLSFSRSEEGGIATVTYPLMFSPIEK